MKTRAFFAAILLCALPALAAPSFVVTHAGRLYDSEDKPASGTVQLTFSLHTEPAIGGSDAVVWTDSFDNVPLDHEGIYTVVLGDVSGAAGPNHHALTPELVAGDRWLAVTVN